MKDAHIDCEAEESQYKKYNKHPSAAHESHHFATHKLTSLFISTTSPIDLNRHSILQLPPHHATHLDPETRLRTILQLQRQTIIAASILVKIAYLIRIWLVFKGQRRTYRCV